MRPRNAGVTSIVSRAEKVSELSGGQRQRVAMGRAMVREPRAFLMDEPLSNLDAKLRVQMRAELARLRDQLGTTTVYVTHDQVEAMTLGDRVAVMRDGVVQQLDTPQNLYANPVNLFVAAFIGSPSMNLFEATIEAGHVVFGGHRLPVAGGLAAHAGRVVVGIRPSDFEDADVWRDDTRAVLDVPVRVVEDLGAEANVIFVLDARPASDTPDGRTPQEEGGEEAQVPLVADAGTTVCTACVGRAHPRPRRRAGAALGRPGPAALLRARLRPASLRARPGADGCGLVGDSPIVVRALTPVTASVIRRRSVATSGIRRTRDHWRWVAPRWARTASTRRLPSSPCGTSSFVSTWRTWASTVRSLR